MIKARNLTVLLTVSTLFVLTIIGSFVLSRSTTAQKNDKTQGLVNQPVSAKFSNKETKKQIPDQVAYELFLRTVGEYNAKGLVERAGFDEREVEIIVGEAKSLNEYLTSNDESARRIKENKNNLAFSDIRTELDKIQTKKDELIDRAVNSYLPNSLTAEDAGKLKEFVNSEVKNNITVVAKPKPAKDKVSFVKTSTKSFLQTSGELYLYSAAWQDDANIFGVGTLSEQYQSGTSYQVSTTLTSPSGRSNTTGSDWSYATLSHNTGLSIGNEDGTYTVQSSFEQADGYYDEYGNFVGTGSANVGNSSTTFVLAPTIFIGNFSANPATVQREQTSNVRVTVSATADVSNIPNRTTIEIELVATGGGVDYTINTPTSTQVGENGGGTVVPNSANRKVIITIPDPAANGERSVTVNYPIRISNQSQAGTISLNLARGNPSTTGVGVQPATLPSASITVTVPTAGGGGGGSTTCYPNGGGGGSFSCSPGYGPSFGPGGAGGGSPGFCCQYSSPLLLDIDGDGYAMTDYYEGVPFDVAGKGNATQTSWTAANSDDAWIVLDRNENNRIDNGTEMFGDASEQPAAQNPRNGFASLAVFDTAVRGGNADGKITRRDTIFRKLRLWQDRNHNGISEPEELSRLPALDVVAVFLDYRESRRTDEHGNRFKFRAKVRDRNDARVGRWAWDVFLVTSPPNGSNVSACALRD
jgi:hypothetical protein